MREKQKRRNLNSKKKERIMERDNWRCYICNNDDCTLEVPHMTPVIRGGSDSADNLVALCHSCHMAIHKDDIEQCIVNAVKTSRRRMLKATNK